MHRKNWLVVVILFLLLPVAIGLYLRAQTPKSPEYISPSNIHSRLEDYAFSSSRVDYRLPKSFWNGRIVNKLPTSIRNLLPKPSSAMWNTCVPFFPYEAILSCAFSIKVPDNVQVGALRIVTADE